MPFDYKKEYRAFYQPPKVPEIIDVPEMQFVCVSGTGDPNEEGGAYQQALGVLYAVSYTLKMSPRAGHLMDGFFDYVVPPLEGFWQQDGVSGMDYERKADDSDGEGKNRPVATNFQFLKILATSGLLLVGACLPQTLLFETTAF